MSVDKISISGPQTSAGILGITSNTNLGGWKFSPVGVVIFAAAFILVVKIAQLFLVRG
ncbi:MAG: preprotein translocase subunit Sec61beta [Candidatus Micrarchaeota archaeon]|nr:preprotein translocase subunit Sec61beta [Candidatus Micrarchaeota archaeon]